MIRITPAEALDHAILYACACAADPRKPGIVIAKLSPKYREALKHLTAADTQVRMEPCRPPARKRGGK